MGIGEYRNKVQFEHPGGVLDPPVWHCAIESAGSQPGDGLAAFIVRGRYHPGITLETKILHRRQVLQVQGITDRTTRPGEMQLSCVEVVGRHGTAH